MWYGGGEVQIYPGGDGSEDDPMNSNLAPTLQTALEWRQPGLTTGDQYGFRLRVYNTRAMPRVYSPYIWLKAAGEPAQMAAPTQAAIGSSATSIKLTWSVPELNGGYAIGYKVYRNNGLGTTISSVPDPTCGSETRPAPQDCTITGLQTSEEYEIKMVSINEIGDGVLSNMVVMTSATVPAKINLRNTDSTFNPPPNVPMG